MFSTRSLEWSNPHRWEYQPRAAAVKQGKMKIIFFSLVTSQPRADRAAPRASTLQARTRPGSQTAHPPTRMTSAAAPIFTRDARSPVSTPLPRRARPFCFRFHSFTAYHFLPISPSRHPPLSPPPCLAFAERKAPRTQQQHPAQRRNGEKEEENNKRTRGVGVGEGGYTTAAAEAERESDEGVRPGQPSQARALGKCGAVSPLSPLSPGPGAHCAAPLRTHHPYYVPTRARAEEKRPTTVRACAPCRPPLGAAGTAAARVEARSTTTTTTGTPVTSCSTTIRSTWPARPLRQRPRRRAGRCTTCPSTAGARSSGSRRTPGTRHRLMVMVMVMPRSSSSSTGRGLRPRRSPRTRPRRRRTPRTALL